MRLPALLWLMVVVTSAAWAASQLSKNGAVDTSILALLPGSHQDPVVERASDALSDELSRRVVLLIGGPEEERNNLQDQAEEIAQSLAESRVFASVTLEPEMSLEVVREWYYPYRYQLLTDQDRHGLAEGDTGPLIRQAGRELMSPVAAGRAASLLEDPLNLLGHWLGSRSLGTGFKRDNKGLYGEKDGRHYRVVLIKLAGEPFDPGVQHRVLSALKIAEGRLDPVSSLSRSGLVFHAAAGADQARSELSTIGLGSLAAVTLLLLWHFRSGWSLVLPILSVAVGLCAAVVASLLVFGRVHMITLAFGASLVGVSVDYAMHYLCAGKALGRVPLRAVLPGITLGLMSSVLAYGAQWFTPFPGLRQIAVFSAFGLVGAWLTVVLWFPLAGLKGTGPAGHRTLGKWLEWVGARGRKPALVVVVATGLAALAGWPRLEFRDDLTDLQSSPQTLVESDQLVQAMSGGAGSSRFLLITGKDDQQVLAREESLHGSLSQLVAKESLQSWHGVSRLIPSVQRQRSDYKSVRRAMLDSDLPETLMADLGLGRDKAARSRAALEAHDEVWLTPAGLNDSEAGLARYLGHLWLGHVDGQGSASVMSLGAVLSPGVYREIGALAQTRDGVRFVDQVAEISSLMAQYRVQVGLWLMVAYGLVALILILRYRSHSWQVLLPPVLATGMTFGLLALAGQSITLFNLLATLLILGIGLDIGIFLRESRGRTHAWEAITLSVVTSTLAFGLLALSETPVLHHFGVMVLPGLVLCWLIAFAISPPSAEVAGRHNVSILLEGEQSLELG